MITWYVSLPGPFAWRPTRRARRSVRHSALYWLLGAWVLELELRIIVALFVGAYYAVTWTAPRIWHLLRAGYRVITRRRGRARWTRTR